MSSIKIDFYIFPNLSMKLLHAKVASLIEDLYHHDKKILVNTNSLNEMQEFNQYLWTFKDISFVPHKLINETNHKNTPVILTCNYQIEINDTRDHFVNLAYDLPDENFSWKNFHNIIDFVGEINKHAARKRYHFYRKLGKITDHHSPI